MKMLSGTIKTVGSLAMVWLTYINHTFTPLIWVLLALIFVDLVFLHDKGQHFQKLGSMAVSLGLPTVISNNLGQPALGKYVVAILCLAYLQLVVPQLLKKVSEIKFSKDPKQNAVDQATIDEILNRLSARETQAAQQVLETAQPLTGTIAQPVSHMKQGEPGNGGN